MEHCECDSEATISEYIRSYYQGRTLSTDHFQRQLFDGAREHFDHGEYERSYQLLSMLQCFYPDSAHIQRAQDECTFALAVQRFNEEQYQNALRLLHYISDVRRNDPVVQHWIGKSMFFISGGPQVEPLGIQRNQLNGLLKMNEAYTIYVHNNPNQDSVTKYNMMQDFCICLASAMFL